ncbi:MAG: hypothetical protein U9N34_09290, partial [Candidatus Cloacimonadota bacterium]|nr:hypothetical protein [Candidatus Cloacimonadota bacterium]
LKYVLGTKVTMTVYRKLKELDYISSCSHRRKYYTLKDVASFDEEGLWFYNSVLFSSFGTIKKTIKAIVNNSKQGLSTRELNKILKSDYKKTLLELFKSNVLNREKISGLYIYFSSNKFIKQKQKLTRLTSEKELSLKKVTPDVLMNELKAGIIIFFSSLNEHQRRLYAGLESMKLGNKGDSIISDLLSINVKTVAKGRKELLSNSVSVETIRKPGGGRKKK